MKENESALYSRYVIDGIVGEATPAELLNECIDWMNDTYKARSVIVVAPRSGTAGNVGLEVVLPVVGNDDMKTVLEGVRAKDGVVFAMESVKREK